MDDWVKVEDALPEEGVEVLIAYDLASTESLQVTLGEYQDQGPDGYPLDAWWFNDKLSVWPCPVVAWMPLPKPPLKEIGL